MCIFCGKTHYGPTYGEGRHSDRVRKSIHGPMQRLRRLERGVPLDHGELVQRYVWERSPGPRIRGRQAGWRGHTVQTADYQIRTLRWVKIRKRYRTKGKTRHIVYANVEDYD